MCIALAHIVYVCLTCAFGMCASEFVLRECVQVYVQTGPGLLVGGQDGAGGGLVNALQLLLGDAVGGELLLDGGELCVASLQDADDYAAGVGVAQRIHIAIRAARARVQ